MEARSPAAGRRRSTGDSDSTPAHELNENIEPFGGQFTAPQPRRGAGVAGVSSWSRHFSLPGGDPDRREVNELRFQRASRDQLVRSLDPACGGECLRCRYGEGGPTLEVTGYAQPRPPTLHAATQRDNLRYQIVDALSHMPRSPLPQDGFRYQPHPTSVARCRRISVAVTSSRRCRPIPGRHSGADLGQYKRWRSVYRLPTCKGMAVADRPTSASFLTCLLYRAGRLDSAPWTSP